MPAKRRPRPPRAGLPRPRRSDRGDGHASRAAQPGRGERSPRSEPQRERRAHRSARARGAARASRAAQPAGDPHKRVLIAHPEVEAGKAGRRRARELGLSPLLVHDGVEAMLQIQRTLPRVVVLDAALPKMFGFQICEIMKRNEQLRAIPVVLIGAIHDQDRYRRPPEELYGADAYVERHQLPDALAELLARFGIQTAPAAACARARAGARGRRRRLRRPRARARPAPARARARARTARRPPRPRPRALRLPLRRRPRRTPRSRRRSASRGSSSPT